MTRTLVVPEVGMRVRWIKPESDPRNERFIRRYLIGEHGLGPFTVAAVYVYSTTMLVELSKDGKPVMETALMSGEKAHLATYAWGYLEPI